MMNPFVYNPQRDHALMEVHRAQQMPHRHPLPEGIAHQAGVAECGARVKTNQR
jgi:hypothetical protein